MPRVAFRSVLAASLLGAFGAGTLISLPLAGPAGAEEIVAHGDGRVEEQQFIDRINGLRASLGLPTLAVDSELTNQARQWSQTMTNAGNIFHAKDLSVGISADWQKLGENVGVGGTVDALFDAFVASPKHYENLVDPVYRYIGIGVVWDGDRMFTAHRFMSVFPPAAPAPAPKPKPAAEPTPAPPTTAPPTTSPETPPSTEPPPVPEELAATEAPAVAPPPDRASLDLEVRAFLAFVR